MVKFTASERDSLIRRAADIPELLKKNLYSYAPDRPPVLLAGADYYGIWVEHNQDAYFLADMFPEAAWESQKIFMDNQRADGLIPAAVRFEPRVVRYAQLQTVWPFARCALAVADKCHRPEEDYARIYRCACDYDGFLLKYRNRSGSGMVEMFCEYDTGHDRSPRVKDGGIPHACPDGDAANMPELPCMPLIAADLSAMRFGALEAMAELAERLGKSPEAAIHKEQALELKSRMMEKLFDAGDEFFYDLAPQGLRKYRTEHITRIFLNKVVDQELFDRIYNRYLAPGKEFFTSFPYPAVSPEDPSFCKELPMNCWGSNTQMLTLIRALIWMPEYGKNADLQEILGRFLRAYCDYSNDFTQEINPFTGAPVSESANYSPSLLLFKTACEILKG
ncbi:MAG: hypothetical protein IKA71_06190 [Lentisphaeria bacterium]|nr:hypothetical protein [Lentisphaeria bacterium]